LEESGTFVGGHTNFVKSRAELAFQGNRDDFKKVITKGIADVIINVMMYGGSIKDVVQSSYLLSLPDWFLQGASSYIAEGWSNEMDNYMRDLLLRKNIKKPSNLEGRDAMLVGQSIWTYIAQKYGDDNIANILNLTRIIRDEQEAIESTFGLSYNGFLREWEKYYRSMLDEVNGPFIRPDHESRVLKSNKRDKKLRHVSINPRGDYLAYTENFHGKYKIKLRKLKKYLDPVESDSVVEKEKPKVKLTKVQKKYIADSLAANAKLKADTSQPPLRYPFSLQEDTLVKDSVKISDTLALAKDPAKIDSLKLASQLPDTLKEDKTHRKILDIKADPELVLLPTSKHKTSTIYRGGSKLETGQVSDNFPIVAWQSSNVITYVVKKRGKVFMKFKNIKNGRKVKLQLRDFDEVLSYDFSDNGKSIIFSAAKKGQSDIYVYDLSNARMSQITNDNFDDLDPQFLKKSSQFIFSSNRTTDTSKTKTLYSVKAKNTFNIYRSKPGTRRSFEKITDTGNNLMPMPYDSGTILYLSDEKGIYNLYKYDPETQEKQQVTNFLKNISSYSVNSKFKAFSYSMLDRSRDYVFYSEGNNFQTLKVEASTRRQNTISNSPEKKSIVDNAQDSLADPSQEELDVNEFRFESDLKKQRKKEAAEKKDPEKKDEFKFKGPYNYKGIFSVDKVISTLMIDPLRGLGIYMEGGMADVFGNHRINAGVFWLSDFKSSSIFGEYQYLKKMVDLKVRFDREGYFFQDDYTIQKYTSNRLAITGSYPLSSSMRISLTPFLYNTRYSNSVAITEIDTTRLYTGLRGEFVYDNTLTTGLNMIEGTRLKIALENFSNPGNKQYNFGKFTFDLRHYQRIHKEIIFATRVSHGQFLGANQKSFLLGGMDNWLFNSTTNAGRRDPLRIENGFNNENILFLKYVTTLRGFNYNSLAGPKYLLFNAELRIHIVKYLSNGSVSSNFFRNLQIIGFTDAGTAWAGKNPFSKDNSINKLIVENSSKFSATVTNYLNPFLVGYGFGLRSMFLGYYMKFDVGWGVANNQTQNPRLYLTFGYDF
jgi:hypothetical protein